MLNHSPNHLPIAVRVYPTTGADESGNKPAKSKPAKPWKVPRAMFVFDTETRIDATQRLTFGSYRFIVAGRCLEEGLFFADDLSADERQILKQYAETQPADTAPEGATKLRLLSLGKFVDRLYRAAFKGRCLLVGFNLPFDLSRIACGGKSARGRFAGGFALEVWSYLDEAGIERHNPQRPRIAIKHIDSKRALKAFTGCRQPDRVDRIPEGSTSGEPDQGYVFHGHFLDLRTLAFALTDRGYSLETACQAFGVEHAKQRVSKHGVITPGYIDYNRRDVLATSELAVKLLEEYSKHPIALQPTKAYSPASIGKSYLRAMGVMPILERQPDFPIEYLGYAQSAFYGGRASAHIRKTVVPVVHTDFLSMYPTVNSLMNLWRFVIAQEIRIDEHCHEEISNFLLNLRADELFDSATWPKLTAFVKVIPDGDVLPSRSKYSAQSNDWQVAVNHISSGGDSQKAFWYSLPDVAASVILTGRVPKIVDAFRIVASGTLSELKCVRLRSQIQIDPRNEDFFKVVIEQRKRLPSLTNISKSDNARLDKALKVLANSASYGIYAEMNRQESDNEVNVTCYGIDADPFQCRVAHPEVAGEFCFPPLAALITGAARLMLSLLEHSIGVLGGTYAMEDTDSMAIIATETGGLVPCTGGAEKTKRGIPAIKALSWAQVVEVVKRFAALNPYSRDAVPGSILKVEDDNYDPKTKEQRQLYCYAISAKRYALFSKKAHGKPELLREGINNKSNHWSEHGLGHLLNPTDPESDDREWTAQIWDDIITRSLGFKTSGLTFENLPAVGRITVSSPAVMRALADFNRDKPYASQIKPFNFLLTCHVKQFGHPTGADPKRFHLISPYLPDARKWLKTKWIDQYTGNTYSVTATGHHGTRSAARVKTYGEIAREYEFHPESKCADANGNPCDKQTIGLAPTPTRANRSRQVYREGIEQLGGR